MDQLIRPIERAILDDQPHIVLTARQIARNPSTREQDCASNLPYLTPDGFTFVGEDEQVA